MSTIPSTTRRGNAQRFWSCVVLCLMGSIACGGETSSAKHPETEDSGTAGTFGAAGNTNGGKGDYGGEESQSGGSAGEGSGGDVTASGGSAGVSEYGDACATVTVDIGARRHAYVLVVDASDSMMEPMPGSTMNRWEYVRDNLIEFVNGLNYSVRVGLLVYPSQDQCSGVGAEIALGQITEEHRANIIDALNGVVPGGGTPLTETYLQGLEILQNRTSDEQTHEIAKVLIIANGKPIATSNCPDVSNTEDFQEADFAAANGGPPIETEVFDLASTDKPDGNTAGWWAIDCSYDAPTPCDSILNGYPPISLAERLLAGWTFHIPGSYSCEFAIPAPPEGMSYDSTQLTLYPVFSGVAQEPVHCSMPELVDEDELTATLCLEACDTARGTGVEDGTMTIALECL
jgi:hypothetical protein